MRRIGMRHEQDLLLGAFGKEPEVIFAIISLVSGPDILITAIPEIPDPEDNA